METLQKFRRIIHTDRQTIPEFLDSKLNTHYNAFKNYEFVNIEILKLCVPRFLPIEFIDDVCDLIEIIFDDIQAVSDFETTIQFYSFLMENCGKYMELAEELELYESAQNIRKLIKLFNGQIID